MCLIRFSFSGPSPPHSATEGIHVFTQPLLNIGLLLPNTHALKTMKGTAVYFSSCTQMSL